VPGWRVSTTWFGWLVARLPFLNLIYEESRCATIFIPHALGRNRFWRLVKCSGDKGN
jgi:hypothetical protein